MCNQSVGLIARVLEEMGIATVTLNLFYEIAEQVLPPRTLHTKFVYGAPFGDPTNTQLHENVLATCLKMLEECKQGGEIQTFPYKWKENVAALTATT